MSSADEIKKIGGFLTETGRLKSRDELKSESASIQNSDADSAAVDNPEAVSSDFQTNLQNGLGAVSARFNEQVNTAASTINENESSVDEARELVDKQLGAATELVRALKNGDDEGAQAKQAELDSLRKERNDLASRIQERNRERVADRRASLNLGNDQRGSVSLDSVEFQASGSSDLGSPEGVDKFIATLKSDQAQLGAQKERLTDSRNELIQIFQGGRDELSKIADRSLGSFEEAEESSRDVASQIVTGGSQRALVNNLSESVVRALLQ